ncbi:MAG: branched-chain amino acid ABC transporter permease, partial [Comamonadaceae bacterium]
FGIMEKFVEGYVSTAAREIVGFSVMILVLLACPQGLFARREIFKV